MKNYTVYFNEESAKPIVVKGSSYTILSTGVLVIYGGASNPIASFNATAWRGIVEDAK